MFVRAQYPVKNFVIETNPHFAPETVFDAKKPDRQALPVRFSGCGRRQKATLLR